jgi:hypothetical protein
MRIIHCSFFTVLTAALLVACEPDDKGDSASDGSTGEQASTGEQGTSTTDEPTGGEQATTGSTGDEEETSTGDATTGAIEDDGCASQCANEAACEGAPDPECVADCRRVGDGYAFSGAACRALYEEFTICMGAATCEELAQPGACDGEFAALISETCTIPQCMDLCARQIECNFVEADAQVECAFACTTSLGSAAIDLGQACVDAGLAALTCTATLSCEQLEEGDGCEAEFAAQQMACGG